MRPSSSRSGRNWIKVSWPKVRLHCVAAASESGRQFGLPGHGARRRRLRPRRFGPTIGLEFDTDQPPGYS